MKFSTLMKIRTVITDKMLEIDNKIEDLNAEASEMKKAKEDFTDQYEANRRQCSKLRTKYLELKDLLLEVESTELK